MKLISWSLFCGKCFHLLSVNSYRDPTSPHPIDKLLTVVGKLDYLPDVVRDITKSIVTLLSADSLNMLGGKYEYTVKKQN